VNPPESSSRPRVVLADDHGLLLEAFEKLLEPEYDVVGKFTDGAALLAAAESCRPDVIVLDVSMPGISGLEAARRLGATMPFVKLIFLTMNEDPDIAAEAFHLGVSGYLLKASAVGELFGAIRDALAGRRYMTAGVARHLAESERQPVPLTPRQEDVLRLLAEGLTMKEVADRLDLTTRTVAFHKYEIMRRRGLRTSAELVKLAIQRGLLST
jgi:DNA-binding NarL/FixJ family response regulator